MAALAWRYTSTVRSAVASQAKCAAWRTAPAAPGAA